jgi:hypothetical protein
MTPRAIAFPAPLSPLVGHTASSEMAGIPAVIEDLVDVQPLFERLDLGEDRTPDAVVTEVAKCRIGP